MAAASVASRYGFNSQSSGRTATRRVSPSVLGSSSVPSGGRRSSSTPAVTSFCRRIVFPSLAEPAPEFPFCEAAYLAHSEIRWPPWPHRLDSGRRLQVKGRFQQFALTIEGIPHLCAVLLKETGFMMKGKISLVLLDRFCCVDLVGSAKLLSKREFHTGAHTFYQRSDCVCFVSTSLRRVPSTPP